MLDKRSSGLLYHEETDWLLVKHLRFRGQRGSLRRLWRAEDCAQMATDLNDTKRYVITSTPDNNQTLRVQVVTLERDRTTTFTVWRDAPHFGLMPLYECLRELCDREGIEYRMD